MDYTRYTGLTVEKDNQVALLTLARPARHNAVDQALHQELADIWGDLARDPEVSVILVTGAGESFSVGGDFEFLRATIGSHEHTLRLLDEAGRIVYGMVNCDKPIISAINGLAIGAGLAVAILADISIASDRARLGDGHANLGVAAGDHACMIWPLLCGVAKAKYYLLTGKLISGEEAERIGLVSMVVDHDELLPTAQATAKLLADGSQLVNRMTKRAINQWLRIGGLVSFDYSLALEGLGFLGADASEGYAALREKRQARFPSAVEARAQPNV